MKILQILILMVFLPIFVHAQKVVLSGTVYDNQGFVIAEARILAKDKTRTVNSADTDNKGVFH